MVIWFSLWISEASKNLVGVRSALFSVGNRLSLLVVRRLMATISRILKKSVVFASAIPCWSRLLRVLVYECVTWRSGDESMGLLEES